MREWIADLREQGPYEGLAGRLSDGHGNYCAMGRLCRLAIELVEAVDATDCGWEVGFALRGKTLLGSSVGLGVVYLAELPPAFAEWLGFTWEDQGELIRINDHYRRSFARVADWIERKLLPRIERRRQGKAWK